MCRGFFLMQQVRAYVYAAIALAGAAACSLYVYSPRFDEREGAAALCFAVLGFVVHFMSFSMRNGVSGAATFLPFMTAAVLAPSWIGLAAIAVPVAASRLALKGANLKTAFNIAQVTLASALAILAYRGLGGTSFTPNEFNLPAYIALVIVFTAVNTLAVSGVVALTESRRLLEVWRGTTVGTLGYDVLSVPFIYVFARVYTEWQALGVAALAIPLLGVRQLYKINAQLEQAHQELLEMMVANLEARDPYTSGHSRRVARNARIIARALGLSLKQVERIGVAALLHDVGKIHEVFAPMLRKPDKLTPEEWAIMQTHPIKSAELVAKVSQLKDALGPVRHHHENWDGSGYPDGLAGEEIPLGARVIMFADTVDAMTTDRPYRRAMSASQVRDEFIRQRGRQFDPEICDRLLGSPQFHLLFVDSSKQHGTPPFSPRLDRPRKLVGLG